MPAAQLAAGGPAEDRSTKMLVVPAKGAGRTDPAQGRRIGVPAGRPARRSGCRRRQGSGCPRRRRRIGSRSGRWTPDAHHAPPPANAACRASARRPSGCRSGSRRRCRGRAEPTGSTGRRHRRPASPLWVFWACGPPAGGRDRNVDVPYRRRSPAEPGAAGSSGPQMSPAHRVELSWPARCPA